MKRSIKNSIYTLPLLLLCFVSLTSFSISWPQFSEWVPNRPTWLRLPTQQDLPIWLQATLNRLKQFLGQKDSAIENEKATLFATMLDEQTIPKQIQFLDKKEKEYRKNNITMKDYTSTLKDEIAAFVTAKDWIDFLNKQKNEFKENQSLIQKINTFIEKINIYIKNKQQGIQNVLRDTKDKLITFLKNQYQQYTIQTSDLFKSYSYQESYIDLTALNNIVVDLLKQNKITSTQLFNMVKEFKNNKKASSAILQAIAIFQLYQESEVPEQKRPTKEPEQINQTPEEILESINNQLSRETDKISYLQKKRQDYPTLSRQISELLENEALTILGLPKDIAKDEIKKKYHQLAKQWHPDKNKGNEAKAAEEFKKIQSAYEVFFPKPAMDTD